MNHLGNLRLRGTIVAGAVATVAAAAIPFAISANGAGPASPQLVAGSSSTTAGGTTSAASTNANAANNGNATKNFAITGVAAQQLEPGGTVNIALRVDNPNNQQVTVQTLSASLNHIDKAATAPAGVCSAANAGLTFLGWTGSPFDVAKNSPPVSAPGVLPVRMEATSAAACQGATFWFDYQGTATK